MIKWTTPSLECCVPDGLEYDFILFTLVQNDYVIERAISKDQVIDNKFTVFFTQEETSQFELYTTIEAQINVMNGGVRVATNIEKLRIDRNLHDSAIDSEIPTIEITTNGTYDIGAYLKANVNVRGGGGSSDYNDLTNKPQINGYELIGNKTLTELGLDLSNYAQKSEIPLNVSQLTNDSQYQSLANVNQLIQNHNESNVSHLDIRTLIETEVENRENADSDLQSQIDTITSASDVVDIVGTYQELQSYDTSSLSDNDIVVVLSDSTHNNAKSYYRWNKSNSQWAYIGSEGVYYTKAEADSLFVPLTRKVNGKVLSSDITLTYSDVGALADTTIIPTNVSQLTNDSNYATETYVQNYIASLNATNTRY